MKLPVPQSSEYSRVMIEITGPDILRRIEASTEVQEIERSFDVDERLLSAKAWFITNAREPVGAEILLKEAEVTAREPELDPDPDPEVSDAEASVEDREETPVEEADEPAEQPAVEVERKPRRRYGR